MNILYSTYQYLWETPFFNEDHEQWHDIEFDEDAGHYVCVRCGQIHLELEDMSEYCQGWYNPEDVYQPMYVYDLISITNAELNVELMERRDGILRKAQLRRLCKKTLANQLLRSQYAITDAVPHIIEYCR
jgi:hypothetical protein